MMTEDIIRAPTYNRAGRIKEEKIGVINPGKYNINVLSKKYEILKVVNYRRP